MCHNTWVIATKLEARCALLRKWKHGNFKWGHLEFCPKHHGWHLGQGRGEL